MADSIEDSCRLLNEGPDLPWEIWVKILSHLTLLDLLKVRLINKKFGYILQQYFRDPGSGYIEIFNYFNNETYHLFEILMHKELCWTRVKTKIGKFAFKLIMMSNAYDAEVVSYKKPYIRFSRTRCLSFDDFKILHKNSSEQDALRLWGKYKHESWMKASEAMKSVIRMECKFESCVRDMYNKSYGTSIPIKMPEWKISKINNMLQERNISQHLMEEHTESVIGSQY